MAILYHVEAIALATPAVWTQLKLILENMEGNGRTVQMNGVSVVPHIIMMWGFLLTLSSRSSASLRYTALQPYGRKSVSLVRHCLSTFEQVFCLMHKPQVDALGYHVPKCTLVAMHLQDLLIIS